jgi:hypothetical protein
MHKEQICMFVAQRIVTYYEWCKRMAYLDPRGELKMACPQKTFDVCSKADFIRSLMDFRF